MTLAANGTRLPDERLFIRDARSLVNAKQYRGAVIDAGSAAHLAMTALIDRTLTGMNLLQREKLFEKNRGLWELSDLTISRSAGTRPDRLQQDLAESRNRAAHEGASLNEAKANAAIAIAVKLVDQLLRSYLAPQQRIRATCSRSRRSPPPRRTGSTLIRRRGGCPLTDNGDDEDDP